jgi:hypothetical protein
VLLELSGAPVEDWPGRSSRFLAIWKRVN